MSIIGSGEMELSLHQMIEQKGLSDRVKMLGTMPSDDVRKYMEKTDVFLFTSDFNEGWGAVLNEAMNSGCAVVASHAAGAVPFLIRNGENGFIYENGNERSLYLKVRELLEDSNKRVQFGKAAYQTIVNGWNAEDAARRIVNLVKKIETHGEYDLYQYGPCSRATILENGWYKEDGYC